MLARFPTHSSTDQRNGFNMQQDQFNAKDSRLNFEFDSVCDVLRFGCFCRAFRWLERRPVVDIRRSVVF